ncbi:MAG: GNAT family N-acetyltransferase [Smithellaceae bacterium]
MTMTLEDKIRLSDLNLAESIREAARWNMGGEIREQGDLLLTTGISPFPTLNVAMNLSDGDPDRAEAIFAHVRSFYAERKSPFSLHLRGHADTALEALCLREKMTPISDAPGMILEQPLQAGNLPPGIEIRREDNISAVVDFRSVSVASYQSLGMPAHVGEQIFATPGRLLRPYIDRVVAYDKDRPVSAAMAIYSHGIAGLYWVGTVPAARGSGLGEACVTCVTNEALARGARFVVLQASKFGAPLYRRMGFATITHYPWYMWVEK